MFCLSSADKEKISISGRHINPQNSRISEHMKQRITYIDELKGFAILTVVIGHVFYFCFRAEGVEYNSPWSELLYSFHMPLFAFLSGLFIKPWANWKALRKSLERLGMPLLVMGGLYTLWRGFSLQDFIHSEFKYGYWFFLSSLNKNY